MKNCFTGAMAVLVLAVACQTEKIESAPEYGTLDVAICAESSFDVVVKSPTQLNPTDAASYNISIFDGSDAKKYGPVEYSAFEARVLPMGTYYVTAENYTLEEAESGNGKMRLAGRSEDIVLSASAISQTATVACEVANARVNVAYDSSVSGKFTGLKVELSGGSTAGRKLTVNETAAGQKTELWFNPSTVTYTITGTFTPTGKSMTLTGTRTLAAKDDVNLLVKLNLDNGEITGSPVITVDVSMNAATSVEEEFNPYN